MLLKVAGDSWKVFVADNLFGERIHQDQNAFKKIGSEEGALIAIAWDGLESD